MIHVLGQMLLLTVEIELRAEPPALLPYKGGPDLTSWHFLAAGRAVRRRRGILHVVDEPLRWWMCHGKSLRRVPAHR